MLLVTTFIFYFIKNSVSDCDINHKSTDSWEIRLHDDILRDYKHFKPPCENPIMVGLRFRLKDFRFDGNEEVFAISTWMSVNWEDARLKWNPSDYNDIASTVMQGYLIWTPMDVLQTQGIDAVDVYFYNSYECQISNTGQVFCMIRTVHRTLCIAELGDWPYDYQICTFKFGTINKKNNIIFTFNDTSGISAFGAEYGTGWNIMDYRAGENATGDTKFYLTFAMERQAEGIAVMIVIPSVLIAVLNVSLMFLDLQSLLRLGLIGFNMLNHFVFLEAISENIPHHGPNSPTVLFFIRVSIFVTLCILWFSIILYLLTKKTEKPFQWIFTIHDYMLKYPVKYVIYPKWQADVKLAENDPSYDVIWSNFASIVNSLLLLIIFIIYLILYFLYIPQPIGMDKAYNLE